MRIGDIEKYFAIVREETESQQKLPVSVAFQAIDNHSGRDERSIPGQDDDDDDHFKRLVHHEAVTGLFQY